MQTLKQKTWEANMELWRRGLIIYTWGNVSEIDRENGWVAIKPSGVPYEALKVEDIVVLDLQTGQKVEGRMNPSSDTPTHLALYRAFPGIGGVTHTHSRHATAWAQAGLSIPCYGTTHADYFFRDIPITRALTAEEVARAYEAETATVIIEAFEGRDPVTTPAVLVRNHGPFTWGANALKSVENAVVLEEVAAMAALTRGIYPAASDAPEYVMKKHFSRKHGESAYYGQNL
ncbi:MAG: L-ribulose-5-phosphate 4-epimerase AraD [Oscillospiraceae bacterium]|jgi:L-ribulose-5-phosphate 4-epimerase|nr:L-ribulose-5-phosphate 4-epimerase AraD [Oscillospiraceae bacterium]